MGPRVEERRRRRGCFDQLLDGNFSICLKWGQKQQRILFLLLHLFLVLLLLRRRRRRLLSDPGFICFVSMLNG
jgi:hypothetical protein